MNQNKVNFQVEKEIVHHFHFVSPCSLINKRTNTHTLSISLSKQTYIQIDRWSAFVQLQDFHNFVCPKYLGVLDIVWLLSLNFNRCLQLISSNNDSLKVELLKISTRSQNWLNWKSLLQDNVKISSILRKTLPVLQILTERLRWDCAEVRS